MAKQLLDGWEGHRWSVQTIGSRIKQCFGKRMAQIVGAERGGKFGCLTKFGNDLANAPFCQRSALAKKEMSLRPMTPGSNSFSPDSSPLSPVFSQMFAMGEIGIEWFTRFLDKRDLAMLESFAPSNDEQAAPG
jgi:hypothetical protein